MATNDRKSNDRPRGERRSGGQRPPRSDKPRSDKPRSDKPRSDKPRSDKPRSAGPALAADLSADELEPAVLYELRTLPTDLGDLVARHLVAADRLLAEDDLEGARRHTEEAKRLARRVAAVREAAGVVSYLGGDYESALADLRTVRRMRGTDDYLPMMADCERGLGRPERALELLRGVDTRSLSAQERVEVALVAAGARADLGQLDAALLLLRAPDLKRMPAGTPRARLEYAYSDLLERAGDPQQALQWLQRAAASDLESATDAAERLGLVESDETITFVTEELTD